MVQTSMSSEIVPSFLPCILRQFPLGGGRGKGREGEGREDGVLLYCCWLGYVFLDS